MKPNSVSYIVSEEPLILKCKEPVNEDVKGYAQKKGEMAHK